MGSEDTGRHEQNTDGVNKLTTPGVEPGLSRPRRDVLTTRRCSPCRCVVFCLSPCTFSFFAPRMVGQGICGTLRLDQRLGRRCAMRGMHCVVEVIQRLLFASARPRTTPSRKLSPWLRPKPQHHALTTDVIPLGQAVDYTFSDQQLGRAT